ncbi:hypothetical protein [Candidatus Liberibacter sp.]|uniref:hypothetical protein n=1 Tax=Candidatus Liberibacter sp. TaxID=34022 RepID=UPI0015F518DC|nr:hypothetical protein [Candidatus Liberibacter sp.]MBA5724009.1 hypothetical protein [Candidatus Liberibacter sp.]
MEKNSSYGYLKVCLLENIYSLRMGKVIVYDLVMIGADPNGYACTIKTSQFNKLSKRYYLGQKCLSAIMSPEIENDKRKFADR